MDLFEARNVSRSYPENGRRVPALRKISLHIEKGEFLALAGPSGSGKTTLLNLLGMLDTPDEGNLCFEGQDISSLPEIKRNNLRRERIGFVFQNFNLIPVLTAYENLEYFLLKHAVPSREIRERVECSLESVGLFDKAQRRVTQLSGGERQRVAIARALVRNIDVVLADEPTAALDQDTARKVIDLMKRLNRERGLTFVFSSHDPAILAAANRVVRLVDGALA